MCRKSIIRCCHKNLNGRFEITNDTSFDQQTRHIVRNRFGRELRPRARFAEYLWNVLQEGNSFFQILCFIHNRAFRLRSTMFYSAFYNITLQFLLNYIHYCRNLIFFWILFEQFLFKENNGIYGISQIGVRNLCLCLLFYAVPVIVC